MLLKNIDNQIQITEANIIDLGKKLGKHLLNLKDVAIIAHHDGMIKNIQNTKNFSSDDQVTKDIINHHLTVADDVHTRVKNRNIESSIYRPLYDFLEKKVSLDPHYMHKLGLGTGVGVVGVTGVGVHKYHKRVNDDTATR